MDIEGRRILAVPERITRCGKLFASTRRFVRARAPYAAWLSVGTKNNAHPNSAKSRIVP
jgi:hypothetical protein